MPGSLNDYEAMTAALGGGDEDFDSDLTDKHKARLQVAAQVARGNLDVGDVREVLDMLGILPGQEDGPSLNPSKTFNPTMDAKGG